MLRQMRTLLPALVLLSFRQLSCGADEWAGYPENDPRLNLDKVLKNADNRSKYLHGDLSIIMNFQKEKVRARS